MKNILVAMMLLTGTAAFADVFVCDLPKDAKGGALEGGPGYSVITENQNVILHVVNGTTGGQQSSLEFVMTKVKAAGEFTQYRADNVVANIIYAPIAGRGLSVSIAVKSGSKTYAADCPAARLN